MDAPRKFIEQGENRLLASLPRSERSRLRARLDSVSLSLKQLVYEAGTRMTHVYFPLSGVMSLVIELKSGGVAEVGTVGNEGMVGTPLLLGADESPTRVFCQVPGEFLRMKAEDFRRAAARAGAFGKLMRRYTQAMINQISQSVACNSQHPIEQRMCRWLLMMHDRAGSDELTLTQEFLSQMLGVRRPSVSVVGGILQKRGLIRNGRARLEILDRAGLEKASCECYASVRAEYERLFDPNRR